MKGGTRSDTLLIALAISTVALPLPSIASDETSSSDKLRILNSNRFTFADNGAPLVTVEIMGGQKQIRLSATGGLDVLPDGTGGAEIHGQKSWTISVQNGVPGRSNKWVIVDRIPPDEIERVSSATRLWKQRGFKPRTFDVGTVFGVGGKVLDSREVLVVVSPQTNSAKKQAQYIARKYKVPTEIHTELVQRPQGQVVATSGKLTIVNPSVLWFAPRQKQKTISVLDVLTGGGGSQLQTSRTDREFFGYVYVTVGFDGKLSAVNAVTADRLLAGLVPSEMFPDAHTEALAAQAIAARTELIQKLGTRHLADPFLLCSSQHCQVYSGAGKEHPRTTRAVQKTRGLVMMRKKGNGLVDARYSASCGGHGENKEIIWGGAKDPVLVGRLDQPASKTTSSYRTVTDENIGDFLDGGKRDYCALSRYSKNRHRWTAELDAKTTNQRVATKFKNVGRVQKLVPLKRGVSGRVVSIEIVGDRGKAVLRGDLAIRRLFGGLKSSLFEVRRKGTTETPTSFVFRGAGFGHGVGMCQVGAIGMAESKKTYRAILDHYYRGSKIQKLY